MAVVEEDGMVVVNTQDAVELLMNCRYSGADGGIVLHSHHLNPDFFDLKTKLAGDILQKFSTYNDRLAIVGDFDNVQSSSLKSFIYESNKAGRILFVKSLEMALDRLTGNR